MRTLVIHPIDPTTKFLEDIYSDKKFSVIRTDIPEHTLNELIRVHDRIIMLGHGTPMGLIGQTRMIVNDRQAEFLKGKECVCIWCNADEYVVEHGLKGFYTGMFISEKKEAIYEGVVASVNGINYSNKTFARIVKQHLNKKNMYDLIKNEYSQEIALGEKVIKYNSDRLYYNK